MKLSLVHCHRNPDARKVEIVAGGLHDPRLLIVDRALAEAREAGENVVCPRFPSEAASSYTPTAEPG